MSSDLQFVILDETATPAVCQLLLESFFVEEPLGISLGLQVAEVRRWLPGYMEGILKEPVSFGAFCNGNLVGVCINVVERHPSLIDCIDQEVEPAMYEVARFLQMLNQGLDLEADLDLGPDSKILTTLFLNVLSQFGGRGIATQLSNKTEELAHSIGASAIQVDTTSEFSYRVYAKLGYKVLVQMDYTDLKHELNGSQVIHNKNIGFVHRCGRVLVKVLKRSSK